MRHLPLLASGAAAQFPITKVRRLVTLLNETEGGNEVKLSRPDASRTRWVLEFAGLSDGERRALTDFFAEQEGRLKTFVFVDPTANLLRHSEDFGQSAWLQGPALVITPAGEGPAGTGPSSRLSNEGAAEQRLEQTIATPSVLPYCFSVWARSDQARPFSMVLRGGVETRKWFETGTVWRRYAMAVASAGDGETLTAAIEVGAGDWLEIAGMQLECQMAPSGYKKTFGRGGVYAKARFDSDQMEVRADGPDDYALTLTISASE